MKGANKLKKLAKFASDKFKYSEVSLSHEGYVRRSADKIEIETQDFADINDFVRGRQIFDAIYDHAIFRVFSNKLNVEYVSAPNKRSSELKSNNL